MFCGIPCLLVTWYWKIKKIICVVYLKIISNGQTTEEISSVSLFFLVNTSSWIVLKNFLSIVILKT